MFPALQFTPRSVFSYKELTLLGKLIDIPQIFMNMEDKLYNTLEKRIDLWVEKEVLAFAGLVV